MTRTRHSRRRGGGRWAAPLALSGALAAVAVTVTLVAVVDGGASGDAFAEETSVPAKRTFTLAWVGDTMLGRDGAHPPDGGRVLFEQVRPWLRSADLTLGNLEGVLTGQGSSKCGGPNTRTCFAFRAPPSNAKALRWAGFDAMNLANNHSLDYGPGGLAETVQALDENKIASAGQPGQITRLQAGGVTVALIGLAPYPWVTNSLDLVGAAELTRAAAAGSDVVVAMVHAGAEGSDQTHTPVGVEMAFGENRGDTRLLAHTLIDAGADLVLGSGPHVIRGVERYQGKLIAYSLGNFAGWHNFAGSAVADQTGVLRLRVRSDGRVLGGRWLSAEISGPGVPAPQKSRISAQLARSVSYSDFGIGAWPIDVRGRLSGWKDPLPVG